MGHDRILEALGAVGRGYAGALRIGVSAFSRFPASNLQDLLERHMAQMLVPPGGSSGQALTKSSSTDHDMGWSSVAGGAGGFTAGRNTTGLYIDDTPGAATAGRNSSGLFVSA